jgi:hypothetical protein
MACWDTKTNELSCRVWIKRHLVDKIPPPSSSLLNEDPAQKTRMEKKLLEKTPGSNRKVRKKQAGAELCQAQAKLG